MVVAHVITDGRWYDLDGDEQHFDDEADAPLLRFNGDNCSSISDLMRRSRRFDVDEDDDEDDDNDDGDDLDDAARTAAVVLSRSKKKG